MQQIHPGQANTPGTSLVPNQMIPSESESPQKMDTSASETETLQDIMGMDTTANDRNNSANAFDTGIKEDARKRNILKFLLDREDFNFSPLTSDSTDTSHSFPPNQQQAESPETSDQSNLPAPPAVFKVPLPPKKKV